MPRVFRSVSPVLCALGLVLILTGCPKQPEVVQAPVAPAGPGAASQPAPAAVPNTPAPETRVAPVPLPPVAAAAPSAQAAAAASPLKDIFFDFDQATVRADQQAALKDDADWLRSHGRTRVRIEGNCDERGTAEYNLALGERRAKVARDALVAAGIPPDSIRTVSYGKERPFVLGHDETAWKWNRRDHFEVEN